VDKETKEAFGVIVDMLEQLGKKSDVLQWDVNEMKKDIVVMKQDIVNMKQDIDGLKQDMGDVKQDIDEMKQDIDEMKQDMEGMKKEITTIKEEQKRGNENLNILISMYGEHELAIRALKAKKII
jgi:chromosome segregation ATPase